MGCRQKYLIIFIYIFAGLGCSSQRYYEARRELASETKKGHFEKFNRQILALSTYRKTASDWRDKARATFKEFTDYRKANNGEINARLALQIQKGATYYLNKIYNPLIGYIKNDSGFYIDIVDRFVIDTTQQTTIETNWRTGKETWIVNPYDRTGQVFLRVLKVDLAAALILRDNFNMVLEPYFKDKHLRRLVLEDIPDTYKETRIQMKNLYENFSKKYNHNEKTIMAIKLFREEQEILKNVREFPGKDSFLDELNWMIKSSLSYKYYTEGNWFQNYYRANVKPNAVVNTTLAKYFYRRTKDIARIGLDRTTHLTSKVFGNTVGKFQSRSGKMKFLPDTEFNAIKDSLKPLDILLEKTPFRLTDKFIPGHYGHVAIWLGSEEELKEIGVWDYLDHYYELARKGLGYDGPDFKTMIRNGHRVLEALRPGVQMNTLRHFMDIDDLAILRPNFCSSGTRANCITDEQKKEYLMQAFKQVGKDYDFNFDVNTTDTIVCSELAYRTYIDINWETSKTLGKMNISPDQVAVEADEPFDYFYPTLVYFNGEKVKKEGDELREVFNHLIKTEYYRVQELTGICPNYEEPCR